MTDRPDDSTAPDSESDVKPDTAPATAPGTAAESAVEPAPDASGAAAEAVPPPPAKPKKVGLLAAIAGVVVALDLLTRIIVVATINPDEPVRVLGGLVYLSLIRNSGAAFSMATGYTWVLAIVAIAVVVVIIRMAPRLRSTPWAVSLGLVLGGAIGNLIDRIFRSPGVLQGHVVDFVSVFGPNAEYFPVFNVADSAITIGGISLVVTALLGIDYDGTSTRKKKAAAADDAAGDAAGDIAGEPKTGAGEDV